jgi:hypothetical protein
MSREFAGKGPMRQSAVLREVSALVRSSASGVLGAMLESHIHASQYERSVRAIESAREETNLSVDLGENLPPPTAASTRGHFERAGTSWRSAS